MRLLDLYCGAGGCSEGYRRAGFEVVGVDLSPQQDYPFEFHQGDALEFPLDGFDAFHASPPCPRFSPVSSYQGVASQHPDLVDDTRARLVETGKPFVIENVPGSPLRKDLTLCGEMFGLRVFRHRVFECEGFMVLAHPHQPHRLRGAKTNCETGPGIARWITGNYAHHDDACEAMGIDWMTSRKALANAIPPAYTEYIGHFLAAALLTRSSTHVPENLCWRKDQHISDCEEAELCPNCDGSRSPAKTPEGGSHG